MTLELKKPAVLLEGGPRHGWAYHEDEIPEMVRVSVDGFRPFPYRRTDRFAVHPRTNLQVESRIWEYDPEANLPAASYRELLAAKDAAMRRAVQASVRDPWDDL
jgi:hypothetical protein